jgi:type IV pilus assembly protein PilQ
MRKLMVKSKYLAMLLGILLLSPVIAAAEYGDDLVMFPAQLCSMEFRSADVKNVLRSLAEPYKVNMLVSKNVEGTITASFDNVYVRDVFIAVLKDAGLDYVKDGDILRVDTFESLEKKRKLAPLLTKKIEVTYAFDSSQTKDLSVLAEQLKKMLSGRVGSEIVAVPRTNTLIVTDIPEYVDKIIAMVKELDKKSPQVAIMAKIGTIDTDFSKELGIQWGGKLGAGGRYTAPDGSDAQTFRAGGGISPGAPNSGERFAVDVPASSAFGAVNLLLGKIGSDILELQLSAMEKNGKGNILSSPKVITQDNQVAKIESGVEVPYQVVEEGGGYKIEFKKAVISLKVTPHVIQNNIFMDMIITRDSIDFTTFDAIGGAPPLKKNELTTKVLVTNGETVVVGGLLVNEKANTIKKVPFLSEVPLLGWLFKYNNRVEKKNELLIFITPTLLDRG